MVKSFQEGHRETSVSFEVGSNHLELHRLVPFLAEQENSNAFLFVDKLDLVRPVDDSFLFDEPNRAGDEVADPCLIGTKVDD